MDLLVFSHLRWDFVYQRPQHLLSRFAKHHRVFFWEEPVYNDTPEPSLNHSEREHGLMVVVPELPAGTTEAQSWEMQRELLDTMLAEHEIHNYTVWYYTPMARQFTSQLEPMALVYDCMDELSAFRGAPPGLTAAEAELLSVADLVFTGGESLYEAKKNRHSSVHLFPSSIDRHHFAAARVHKSDPADQANIAHPRIGYCGVIDERMDLELVAAVAEARPDWQFVMVGPVVKISGADLPRRENIHYLGAKKYEELPGYLSGWDVSILPFAKNESTRFISPTKTPEYLAAGLPVVSTSIKDVVRPYGDAGLVAIADTPPQFVRALEQALAPEAAAEERRRARVDEFLSRSSWDKTFAGMRELIQRVARQRTLISEPHVSNEVSTNSMASAD